MPELDRDNLEDEFGLTTNDENTEVVEPEGPDPFEVEFNNDNSTEQLLRDNIDRANAILDQLHEEMSNGNFSARLVEVAGQIINSVSSSVKEIQQGQYGKSFLLLKARMTDLKKFEIETKAKQGKQPTNQNLIVADRESVLKLLEDSKKKDEKKEES
jgi:hypothetical protein